MTSPQGRLVVCCVPIQLQSTQGAFGPRLEVDCPFPLFPNPGVKHSSQDF